MVAECFNDFLASFNNLADIPSLPVAFLALGKQALGKNKYIAAVLMDLSKAFDCLPHKLLLLKLEAYGMSKSALQLIENYLTNRKQCVKVGTTLSNWQDIYKGVPQGSILDPVLFNIFLNDIFHFTTSSTLYNYADDNGPVPRAPVH
jgi:retron-type reverse transcriptase